MQRLDEEMKRVFLLGGGMSVKEGINLGLFSKISGQDVWSINYAFMTMPYLPKREVWVDVAFYKSNIDALQKLWEQGVEIHCKQHMTYAGIKEHIHQYGSTRESKFYYGKHAIQNNLIYYGRMGLSGIFALSLAIAEGYEEIYLLGYDFGTPNLQDKNTHYYQDTLKVYSTGVIHPEIYRTPDNAVKREVEDFRVFLQEPIKILNCSMISNIPYFEKITYNQLFERIKSVAI